MTIVRAFEDKGVRSTDLSRQAVEDILRGDSSKEAQQLTFLE